MSQRQQIYALLILLIAASLGWLLGRAPLFDHINYLVQDHLMAHTTAASRSSEVVIIGIDDATSEAFPEPIVMWHRYLAGVIEGAVLGEARALGIDLIPAISLDWLDPELDRALFRALRLAQRSDVAVILGYDSGEQGKAPLRKFQMAASGLGYLNLWPDRDGMVRSYRLTQLDSEGRRYPSLAGALLQQNGQSYDPEATPYIDFRLSPPPIISMQELYQRQQAGDVAWLQQHLAGKTLLLGITTRALHDHHTAPPSPATAGESWIYGVMLHALTLEAAYADALLRPPPPWLGWLVFPVALLTALLFLRLPPWRAAALVLLFAALLALGVVYALLYQRLLIPAAPLLTAILLPGLLTGLQRYMVEYQQFRRLQRYFKSYVSPEVMREIIDHPEDLSLGGSTVTATIMFTDIRNFTTLSERMRPEDVVAGLNRYFAAMTHSVIEHGGYLNRYLGDGILAIFGAPARLPHDGAAAAVESALEMQRRLRALNRSGLFPGIEAIEIGIGIHTGEAIVGNIGCAEKMDYSIIGDAVNLASRIESKTKELVSPILISERTKQRLGEGYLTEFVGSVHVKGREQAVNLYQVLDRGEPIP